MRVLRRPRRRCSRAGGLCNDPLVDWAAERTIDDSARCRAQRGHLALRLTLDEIKSPLSEWHTQSAACLDGLRAALVEVLEGHSDLAKRQAAHAEAVRDSLATVEEQQARQIEASSTLQALSGAETELAWARQEVADALEELSSLIGRYALWRDEHVRCVQYVKSDWLGQATEEVTALAAQVPAYGKATEIVSVAVQHGALASTDELKLASEQCSLEVTALLAESKMLSAGGDLLGSLMGLAEVCAAAHRSRVAHPPHRRTGRADAGR